MIAGYLALVAAVRNVWIDVWDFGNRLVTFRYAEIAGILAAVVLLDFLPAMVHQFVMLALVGLVVVMCLHRRWLRSTTRRRWQNRTPG